MPTPPQRKSIDQCQNVKTTLARVIEENLSSARQISFIANLLCLNNFCFTRFHVVLPRGITFTILLLALPLARPPCNTSIRIIQYSRPKKSFPFFHAKAMSSVFARDGKPGIRQLSQCDFENPIQFLPSFVRSVLILTLQVYRAFGLCKCCITRSLMSIYGALQEGNSSGLVAMLCHACSLARLLGILYTIASYSFQY